MISKTNTLQMIVNFIAQKIYDKKGTNILALNLEEVHSMTDYLIIAEGNIDRHVKAIASFIIEEMKKKWKMYPQYVEGLEAGDWVVIDYFDIMIHLFMPGLRDKYNLEELWKDGKIVEVDIQIEKNKDLP